MLLGRAAELDRVADLLESAGSGDGGALLLVGEPGMGKTALLNEAVGRAGAEGMRVIRAAGIETEANLPYAALG
jgi:predicted ATPase